MIDRHPRRRAAVIAASIASLLSGMIVPSAAATDSPASVLALLNAQPCLASGFRTTTVAQLQPSATPQPQNSASPSPSPSPSPSASFIPGQPGPFTLVPPQPSSSPGATPPPVPTASPTPVGTPPVYLIRGGPTPPPVIGAGTPGPAPTAVPSAAPTLEPGMIAVIADRVEGSSRQGEPGDAYGNVHIYSQSGEITGGHAHYDGTRTITIDQKPYLINRARDSVMTGSKIEFDTITNKSEITDAHGVTSQEVERGRAFFSSPDLHTDADGIGHGTNGIYSTCENMRGGYHLSSKTMTYYPGDKIVLNKVILWLGAAAIFWLPRVVIPLRRIEDETQRPQFFPDVGYNKYQGAYVRMRYGFGKDQYYYGDYQLEFYTKLGLSAGYEGYFNKKNGKRSDYMYVFRRVDRSVGSVTYNANLRDTENFSPTLHGQFGYTYTDNYNPLFVTQSPPQAQLQATMQHSGAHASQTWNWTRSTTYGFASNDSFSLTDSRQWGTRIQQSENYSLQTSRDTYGGISSQTNSMDLQSITHYAGNWADYNLTYDNRASFSSTGNAFVNNDNKLPELQVVPHSFLKNFWFPVSPQLVFGYYTEPTYKFGTIRADMLFNLGPELLKIGKSDLSLGGSIHQFAYGTGDLKAAVTQNAVLNTPLGNHFANTLTYNESQYAGPQLVPFTYMDQQTGLNNRTLYDSLRVFNGDVYNLQLNWSSYLRPNPFQPVDNPISYSLSVRPSPRSYVYLSGSFVPGWSPEPRQGGFSQSIVQFVTPLGYETTLQFYGTLDWKSHAGGFVKNQNIAIAKTIGECYQVQAYYNQASKSVNFAVNLLAFPSHAINFGIQPGSSLIPSSLNP